MTPDRLYHLTLSTGHARWSPRSDVSDHAITVCAALLRRGMDRRPAEAVEIPGPDGEPCALTAARASRCLMATIWGPALLVDGERARPPLVTLGVAARSRCAPQLWTMLGQTGDPPPTPWAAAKLHETAGLHTIAMPWLGDLERCLAWAWIERREEIVNVER